jgi:hypothetical protein
MSTDPFAELDRAIAEAGQVERAQLIVAIAARLARLAAPATVAPTCWITPETAAELAQVPAKRVRAWSRRATWAHRPTRKALRIDRDAFEAWLKWREKARTGANRRQQPVSVGANRHEPAAIGARAR